MKVVALDIATNTGVCIREDAGAPQCFSEFLGKGSEDARFSKLLVLTDRLINEHRPDFVAVEAAIGGPKASQYLIGLVACVRAVCFNRGVVCKAYHLGSIRKHFVGKSLTVRDFPGMSKAAAKVAIKKVVMDRCALLGWDVPDHDAADAAALADYALAMEGAQVRPGGGLFV